MTAWRPLVGYNGRYRVSEDGGVQTRHVRPHRPFGPWRDMSTPVHKTGYRIVYLYSREKGRERWLVHRLVALTFLGLPLPGREHINHRDGVKLNNHFTNLEWCNSHENMDHAWRTGLCRPKKLDEHKVREILTCGGTDTETAMRFGVSQVLVTRIRARKAWKRVAIRPPEAA